MKAIERLFAFFENKGLKHTPVERELGLTNGYLGKMRDRKGSIGSDILETIFCKFPNLSPDWLLTGRGSMLREDQPSVQATAVPVTTDSGEASVYYKMYKEEKAEKETLIEQIGQLKERLRVQEEKIEGLKKADVPFQKDSVGSTPIRKKDVAGLGSAQFAGKE